MAEEYGSGAPVDGETPITARTYSMVSTVATEVGSRFRSAIQIAKYPLSSGEDLVHMVEEELGEVRPRADGVGEVDDGDQGYIIGW